MQPNLSECSLETLTSKPATEIFKAYTNKEVPFKFMGTSFSYALSPSLFSSFDIDAGSRLLLKSIAANVDLEHVESIADIGCGVGILGLSLLGATNKSASLSLQDRSLLALLFSANNAVKNNLCNQNIKFEHTLMLQNGEQKFDLIVSNIPAKAGNPVIEEFIAKVPSHLSNKKSTACIVIVAPLASLALATVKMHNLNISYSEQTKEYLVLHIKKDDEIDSKREAKSETASKLEPAIASKKEFEEKSASKQNSENQIASLNSKQNCSAFATSHTIKLDSYIRESKKFTLEGTSYNLQTVYGLKDFDEVGFHLSQMAAIFSLSIDGILKNRTESKKKANELNIAFFGFGQGHLPAFVKSYIAKNYPNCKLSFSFFSDDALESQITMHNLGIEAVETGLNCSFLSTSELANFDFDLILFNPINFSLPHEVAFYSGLLNSMLASHIILSAKSTEVANYLKGLSCYSINRNKKSRGFRGVELRGKR